LALSVRQPRPLISGTLLSRAPFLCQQQEDKLMAFYNKTDDLPRDPSAIDQGYTRGDGMVSAVIVLLIIAAACVLYFMYAGSGPTQPAIAPPVTENAPAPAPATQPPTQTPTP
jgi:hypothetical protein